MNKEKVQIPVISINDESYISAKDLIKLLDAINNGITFHDDTPGYDDAVFLKNQIFEIIINNVKEMEKT